MPIDIQQIEIGLLARYAAISISFKVESVLRVDVIGSGLGGLALVEEKVALPYVKDYDGYGDGGDSGPLQWPQQFDVRNWGFFLALDGDQPVGGAAVAMDAPDVNMLERRKDLAVLWDIRVHPDMRGRGIGSKLFWHAVDWARQKGCKQFKIETQNINVPACRFYAKQGCELGAIHRYGYAGCPDVAHEAMLLWYLEL
jgi:GNAT superfamily N-acetyltransferase